MVAPPLKWSLRCPCQTLAGTWLYGDVIFARVVTPDRLTLALGGSVVLPCRPFHLSSSTRVRGRGAADAAANELVLQAGAAAAAGGGHGHSPPAGDACELQTVADHGQVARHRSAGAFSNDPRSVEPTRHWATSSARRALGPWREPPVSPPRKRQDLGKSRQAPR